MGRYIIQALVCSILFYVWRTYPSSSARPEVALFDGNATPAGQVRTSDDRWNHDGAFHPLSTSPTSLMVLSLLKRWLPTSGGFQSTSSSLHPSESSPTSSSPSSSSHSFNSRRTLDQTPRLAAPAGRTCSSVSTNHTVCSLFHLLLYYII